MFTKVLCKNDLTKFILFNVIEFRRDAFKFTPDLHPGRNKLKMINIGAGQQ